MYNFLPGTAVELDKNNDISDFFKSLFAAGGLVLSQVLQLTGLSVHAVQNWVKRKYLRPPVNKKYDCGHFCTIAIINMLSGTFSLDDIRRLIDYVEVLDADAAIHIYTLFVGTLAEMPEPENVPEAQRAIDGVLSVSALSYEVKARLRPVIRIMVMAHFSSVLKLSAHEMLDALDV